MSKEGNMSTGIMIIGPSGSGKTTLGKVVAEKLGYPYFDVDDYIWKQDTVEPDIRVQRVHNRAIARFGERVLEGGDMYESHMKFLEENPRYESDGSPNLSEQREWMKNMPCVKTELDGTDSIESNAKILVENWNKTIQS